MGCCKCAEYNWPDPQEVVWKDPEDGKAYCVFHAPSANAKRIQLDGERHTAESFNKLIQKWVCTASNENKLCELTGAVFPWTITFYCGENVDITGINLSGSTFSADFLFVRSTISKPAFFLEAKFCGEVRFLRVDFSDVAVFQSAVFSHGATFGWTTFVCEASFRGVQAQDRSLHIRAFTAKSLQNMVFTSSELSAFSYSGCRWPDRLGLDTHAAGNYLDCEELYRAMKQRAAEEHDQPQVSRWHFREKLMFKKQRWYRRWLPVTLTWWYWATSGFGERAVRAGVWLLALVALSFALNATPQPLDWNTLWGAAAANATLATIPFAKDIPGDGWVKVMRGFWQFLIAVQFTLFALAVRNRFRR